MRRRRISNLDRLGGGSRNLDAIFPPADLNLAKVRFASPAFAAFVVITRMHMHRIYMYTRTCVYVQRYTYTYIEA